MVNRLASWSARPGGIFLFVVPLAMVRVGLMWMPIYTDRTWAEFLWYALYFVIGFILMFALSTTGIFAPASHYQGKYFGNTADQGFKEENLLKPEQIQLLRTEIKMVERADYSLAMSRLIENGKIMSIEDDNAIRSIINDENLSDEANTILTAAHKAVHHTAKKIEAFRDWITWLFAFGLVGLGMQITVGSMKQAGGEPAIIGGIVGFIKAALSLIVVLLLITETV